MPSIEITAEQAQALANGEDVTLKAVSRPSVQKFIAVSKLTGLVLEYETHDGKPQPWTVLRPGNHGTYKPGYRASVTCDFQGRFGWSVTEVQA